MKAYLFIETESKIPTEGDWFLDESGEIYQADMYETEPSMNLKRHEIPIPEGAKRMLYDFELNIPIGSQPRYTSTEEIPLPRPKKKVKKTVYLSVRYYDGRPTYSVYDINEPPEGSYPVEIEVEE